MANKRFHRKPKIQPRGHEWLYGINAVEAAVSSSYRKHFAMWVKHPVGERIQRLQKAAEERGILIKKATPEIFETYCPDGVHQGVLLECSARHLETPTSLPATEKINPIY